MTSEVTEGLSGIRMARTYRLEEPLSASADSVFERLFGLRYRQNRWQARVGPMMEVLVGIAVAILLFVVGLRIRAGTITIADFTGLLTGLGVIAGPARRLGGNFASVQQGAAGLDRVFMLFDTENTIVDGPDRWSARSGRSASRTVDFAYPDGHLALDGFGLVDRARAAGRLRRPLGGRQVDGLQPAAPPLRPDGGPHLLDGHDIRSLTLASLRDQIAVVSQDAVLLSGTVAANIGFGRRAARARDRGRRPRRRRRRLHPRAAQRLRHPGGARPPASSPAASASACPSPAPSCATRPSCSSTSRPRRSTPRARR